MDRGSWHCTGGSDQEHPQEMEMQKGKMVVWVGLTNSYEKKSTWTMNFQMFKLVLEKEEEPEIKLQTSLASLKKQESSRNTSTAALVTVPKPLTVWKTINCGKLLKRWEYQTTLPASWEICMQVKKQKRTRHGTTDWF